MFRILLTLLFILFILSAQAKKKLNSISSSIESSTNTAYGLVDSDLSKAEKMNLESLKLLLNHNNIDPIVKSDVYSLAGTIAFQKGNYKRAIKYSLTCLQIREKTGNKDKIATVCRNIANLYYKTGKIKKAIFYYKKCLSYSKSSREKTLNMIPAYNGLILTYDVAQQNDSVKHYYQLAFDLINHLPATDRLHNSVSDVYCNYGQYLEVKGEYETSMNYYKKALDIQRQINDQSGMGWIYHHMGIVNDYKTNSTMAKYYFNIAQQIAEKQMDIEMQRDLCESRILLYTREKKLDSVAWYFEQYKDLNDSINEEKTNKQLIYAEAKYQTEKTQLKLKAAEVENQNILLGSTLGLIIIISILYFLIRTYRQKQRIALMQVDLKNKEINELLNQQETASFAAMLEGQDHERFRIAQDLHDRLGSTLAAIKLGMQGDPVSTNRQNQQLVDTAITEVRSIAHNLSGGNIERYGLSAALNELKFMLERSGKMRVHLYLEPVTTGNQLSIELYRIVQELVSNTLKHANATEITIQLNDHQDSMNLIYEDNGSGFDASGTPEGMGIRNIHLRLKKWEGTLEIDSQPRRGTIMIIHVPKTNPL